jgi:hypothetical protein
VALQLGAKADVEIIDAHPKAGTSISIEVEIDALDIVGGLK